MSDGPHRSLPMRRPWKELAKRGDQLTYDSEQVAEAAAGALVSDFRNEVKWSLIDTMKSIFSGKDNSLKLPELALQELENAKALAAGSVFGRNVVAWGIELINEGRFGMDALYEAIGLAAKMRGFANARSVEEHFLRESDQRRASHVSNRLNSAIASLSESKLGAMLANPQTGHAKSSRKKTDIDDGVPL